MSGTSPVLPSRHISHCDSRQCDVAFVVWAYWVDKHRMARTPETTGQSRRIVSGRAMRNDSAQVFLSLEKRLIVTERAIMENHITAVGALSSGLSVLGILIGAFIFILLCRNRIRRAGGRCLHRSFCGRHGARILPPHSVHTPESSVESAYSSGRNGPGSLSWFFPHCTLLNILSAPPSYAYSIWVAVQKEAILSSIPSFRLYTSNDGKERRYAQAALLRSR